MHTLTDLTGHHPILSGLAPWLSALDLFSLAQTCRANYSVILASRPVFNVLRRACLCDGRGLKHRQNFTGQYSIRPSYTWGKTRKIWQDEPIEVRLWGTTCDASNALPCRKCGVNVCEECRYYPREMPHSTYPSRRPHLNSPWQNENVMCLCPSCDAKLEAEKIQGRFFSELCDCDIYTRWICHKCKVDESNFTRDHYAKHTMTEHQEKFHELVGWDDEGGETGSKPHTKEMMNHQFSIWHFCPCGAAVPEETVPRCTWCMRRHLPEDQWSREYDEIGSKMPWFEDDPCYPPYIGNLYADCCEVAYPDTGYRGPIWVVPEAKAGDTKAVDVCAA